MENKEVIRILNSFLNPLLKAHGFKRKGRVYYKVMNDIVFMLGTKAVGSYFAQVTGFPSCAFSLVEGFWVSSVDYWNAQVNLVPPNIQLPDVFSTNAVFHINDNYGNIMRKVSSPYLSLNLDNPKEMERRNLWLIPNNEEGQNAVLNEMKQQIMDCFLDKYEIIAKDYSILEEYTIGRLRQYNIERGYEESKSFVRGSYFGNYCHYFDYAILFYKKYGPVELYNKYFSLLNEWHKVSGLI